jgi:D-methionine transport system substrate-binding protein
MSSVNILIFAFCITITFALISCDKKDDNTIRVGVITGPMQKVAEVAKKVAKEKYGLNVEVIGFNDYVMPNEALLNGDIDLNAYQHEPYFKQQEKERGYRFAVVGKTFIYPIAGYSEKISSINELHEGDEISIPNDPTNLSRSLLLLQSIGLLTLKESDTPPHSTGCDKQSQKTKDY